jgi:transcriptional regulator with XRE-family HTH domain
MSDIKAPNDIDRRVGHRIRLRRSMLGMSQEKLGEAVGITFQQVQKYERGTNRVSASRLWQVATALDVKIDYFFATGEEESGTGFSEEGASYEAEPTISADGLKLMGIFHRIQDPRIRRKVVDLASLLGSTEADEKPDDRSK